MAGFGQHSALGFDMPQNLKPLSPESCVGFYTLQTEKNCQLLFRTKIRPRATRSSGQTNGLAGNVSLVHHPRDVFRPAVVSAAAMVLLHDLCAATHKLFM